MSKYTREKLEAAISVSTSYAEVCRIFKIKESTGAQSYLANKIRALELDTSHFLGQAHSKGKSFKKKDALNYCFKGSTENSDRLKKKLIRDGYKKAECENCTWTHWMGKPLVLELHHVDGDHSNNELTNLQVLCPNCHAMITKYAPVGKLVKSLHLG